MIFLKCNNSKWHPGIRSSCFRKKSKVGIFLLSKMLLWMYGDYNRAGWNCTINQGTKKV